MTDQCGKTYGLGHNGVGTCTLPAGHTEDHHPGTLVPGKSHHIEITGNIVVHYPPKPELLHEPYNQMCEDTEE